MNWHSGEKKMVLETRVTFCNIFMIICHIYIVYQYHVLNTNMNMLYHVSLNKLD